MQRADDEDDARFIAIGKLPYEDRSKDEHDFFQSFAKVWFIGQSDRKIMQHRGELLEAWNIWKEERHYYDVRPTPSSTYALAPETPRVRNTYGEYVSSQPQDAASAPRRRELSAAERAGWGSDEAYQQFLYRCEEGNRWRDRAQLAAKVTVAGAVVLGVVLGERAALGTKMAAEKVGTQVRRLHREDETFAKESVKNPHIALPRDLAKQR